MVCLMGEFGCVGSYGGLYMISGVCFLGNRLVLIILIWVCSLRCVMFLWV